MAGTRWFLMSAIFTSASLTSGVLAQVRVDERLPDYRPVEIVSGTLKSIGSDSLNNLMTLWAATYINFHPKVRIEVEGKG